MIGRAADVRDIDNFVKCTHAMRKMMVDQIGMMNVLATSGGKIHAHAAGLTLPCHTGGYRVTVDLEAGDTYCVRRIVVRRKRGELVPTTTIKGERTGVYAEQLGETVYRAGCFRDEW